MSSMERRDLAVSRRSALLGAAGVIVAGVATPGASASAMSRGGEVGANGAANGLEFIAEITQVADLLTGCGYFSAVSGLGVDQLFFGIGGDRTEANARFTFHATARLTGIQRRDDVFVAHADGELNIYLRDTPGATFDDPSSFAQGLRIASDRAAFEDVNNVIAPNTGVVTVFGDLRRTAIAEFKLDGKRYHLGQVGLRSRLVAPGKGTRLDPVGPRSILIVGGNVTNPDGDDHGG